MLCYGAAAGLGVHAVTVFLGLAGHAGLGAVALVAALLAGIWGGRVGRQAPGFLCWTGDEWLWLPPLPDQPGQPSQPSQPSQPNQSVALSALRVTVDLGQWLLVRSTVKGSRRLFWVVLSYSPGEGADQALRWTALRAALYSTATPPDGLPGRRPADPE